MAKRSEKLLILILSGVLVIGFMPITIVEAKENNITQTSEKKLYSDENYSWNIDENIIIENLNDEIGRLTPEVYENFRILKMYNDNINEQNEIMKIIEEFYKGIEEEKNIDKTAEKLTEEFKNLEQASRNIYEKCEDERLLREVEPWILSFEQLGIAGQAIIQSILDIKNDNFESWWSNYSKTKHALDEMKMIDTSNNFGERKGVKVASNTLTPFVKEMYRNSEKLYNNSNYGKNKLDTYDYKIYTNIENIEDMDFVVEDDEIIFQSNNHIPMKKNDYLGLKLGEFSKINDVLLDFESNSKKNVDLEYSINGIEWKSINSYPVSGKYIRFINNGDENINIDLEKFNINISINKNININTNSKEILGSIENLTDGDKESFVISKEQRKNDYYEVDLGTLKELNDIAVYMDTDDYIKSGVLEVSKTKERWTVLNDFSSEGKENSLSEKLKRKMNRIFGKVEKGSLGIEEKNGKKVVLGKGDGEKYRYIRIRIDEDSNSLSKLYEIEINKEYKEDIITFVTGLPNGELEKVSDGRESTAYVAGANPEEGDFLLYNMTTIKPVKNICILQDENNISMGKLSVRTLNEGWIQLGILDKAFNDIELAELNDKNILDIKIEWEENGIKPFIYEITPIYYD